MKIRNSLTVLPLILLTTSVLSPIAMARPVLVMSYAEMVKKADLVVIATPKSTKETGEFYKNLGVETVGVETIFDNATILKDTRSVTPPKVEKEAAQSFVLHYHKALDSQKALMIIDGPGLLQFDSKDKSQYLMFLKKMKDGRFEPLSGQIDPYFSIEKLKWGANK